MSSRKRRAWLTASALLLVLGGGVVLVLRGLGEPDDLSLARAALEQRDFESAGRHLDGYLSRRPHDLTTRLLAARTARRNGDYEAAGRHLRAFEQSGGPRDPLQLERELIALQRGNLSDVPRLLAFCRDHPDAEEAPVVLEAIIEGCLNSLNPPFALHPILPTRKPLPEAYHQARDAIGLWFARPLAPAEEVQGLVWRARQHELGSEHAAAITDLQRATELDPHHRLAHFLAAVFCAEESPRVAKERLERLLTEHPDDARILYSYATVLRGLGLLNEARVTLDQLLARDAKSSQALLERGLIALDLERPGEAEPYLQRALAAAPNDQDVLLALGRCMRQLGRNEEAARYQERFLELEREREAPKK